MTCGNDLGGFADSAESRPKFKQTLNPRQALGEGYHSVQKNLSPERSFVVYAKQERYSLAHDVEAIRLREMAGLARNA